MLHTAEQRTHAAAALPADLQARVNGILAASAAHRTDLRAWTRTAQPGKSTTDAEWRAKLDPSEYHVLRERGTERRGGEYDAFQPEADSGHFACRGCGRALYSAASKFPSGCGWPAFDRCYENAVDITQDNSHSMLRIEITCSGCDGHLGHVFAGERKTRTNERHCVNSLSVQWVADISPQLAEEGVTSMKKLARIKKRPTTEVADEPCAPRAA